MAAQKLLEHALSEGRKNLLEPEAYEILSSYSIPICPYKVVDSIEEAESAANSIGYPIVVKIVSPDIIHKSDIGGVRIGIKDEQQLKEDYASLLDDVREKAPSARIVGVLVEKMAPKSVEVVVGMLRDPTFGPAVMFGLGGVLIEIMKDVIFRITPVSKEEAIDMIKKVKGYPLLSGFRGSKPLDVDAIADVICNVSRISTENPVIDQVDLNPVIVYEKGLVVVDARIILKA
ncbi:MAG: acetate--CoA ligase family protein [Nitrososphaeria archaeon]|jgi:acetyl-CoA synthetase (ADP-forming)